MKRRASIQVVLTGFLWAFLSSSVFAQLCPCFTPTGIKRPTPTADFRIDCSTLPPGITCNDFENAVIGAARTWNTVGTNFQFNLTPNTLSTNVVRFGPLDSNSNLALTENEVDKTGLITMTTLTFNIALQWATTGRRLGPPYDVQGIATHEFGHWFHLDDILSLICSAVTMSSRVIPGLSGFYLRTLSDSDKSGVRFIYGPDPPRLLPDLTVPSVEVVGGANVMFDVENRGCGPAEPTTHNIQAISVNDADIVATPVFDRLPLPPGTATSPCPGQLCPRRSSEPLAVYSFDKECFYRVTADISDAIQEVRERNNTGDSPITQCLAPPTPEPDIVVDGDPSDWFAAGIAPLIIDPAGDVGPPSNPVPLDMISLRVTNDGVNVYFLYEFSKELSSRPEAILSLDVDANSTTGGCNGNEYELDFFIRESDNRAFFTIYDVLEDCRGLSSNSGPPVAVNGNFIEASVPINLLKVVNPTLTMIDISCVSALNFTSDLCNKTRYVLTSPPTGPEP